MNAPAVIDCHGHYNTSSHYLGADTTAFVQMMMSDLFASEMVGAVRGIDPTTGFNYDDTKRYIDAADLSDEARRMIFSENALRVYPRLAGALEALQAQSSATEEV